MMMTSPPLEVRASGLEIHTRMTRYRSAHLQQSLKFPRDEKELADLLRDPCTQEGRSPPLGILYVEASTRDIHAKTRHVDTKTETM